MRPAAFVPETKRVVDLFASFSAGAFSSRSSSTSTAARPGLVTVEDVVEELVGEIRDEYDSEAEPIVREADGAYVFSGKVAIGEMTDRLGVEIEGGGFETVGGYVLARVGRVPSAGERFDVDGLEVEMLEAERRRIHKVRIRPPHRRRPKPGMKAGYVSLVGRPNAGKSTLLNRFVGQKVAIVSDKPQTTRHRIMGVRNIEGGQMVFIDTPGIHKPRAPDEPAHGRCGDEHAPGSRRRRAGRRRDARARARAMRSSWSC